MAEPAFIVEGHLEQKAIQLVCPGKKVVLLGANGNSVSISTICDRIETQFRLFSNRFFPIIVMFDRESRDDDVVQIEEDVRQELIRRKVDDKQFIMFVSDRQFECLFAAHVSTDGTIISTGCPHTDSVDGLNGSSVIRERLGKKGIRYHKTTTGVDLFKNTRPSVVATKSVTFSRFLKQITGFCQWAKY